MLLSVDCLLGERVVRQVGERHDGQGDARVREHERESPGVEGRAGARSGQRLAVELGRDLIQEHAGHGRGEHVACDGSDESHDDAEVGGGDGADVDERHEDDGDDGAEGQRLTVVAEAADLDELAQRLEGHGRLE